jgi:hypothetical protein
MLISHKYEVVAKVGAGGMGTVYKVRHTSLDTVLALKVLAPQLLEVPDIIQRFHREARVIARLHHPNIVRVVDIDRDDEQSLTYIVMEYVQGKTLEQYLHEHGALPLVEGLEIARQVATALAYAHGHQPPVIHRDIKPANIMLEEGSGRAVVMDFGIAKVLDDSELTKAGHMIGTLRYCPPEQIRGEPLRTSADIYSLGMVVYEMYTGRQFFAGMERTTIIGRLLYESGDNEPHFDRPPPPAFRALVRRAIAREPTARYQSMADFLRDLEACRADAATVVAAGGGAPVEPTLGAVEDVPEDRWEMGDGRAAERRPAGAAPPRQRRAAHRAPPIAAAGAAIAVLAGAAWWLVSSRHPAPAGDHVVARAPAPPASPPAAGPVPPRGAPPAAPPAPALEPPAAESPPPELRAALPDAESVELATGATQTFRIEVADHGVADLTYTWTVDGEKAGDAATLSWTAGEEGRHTVEAAVRDGAGRAVTRRWEIAVRAPEPGNRPPRIERRSPAETAVVARAGDTLAFSATAADPDGDALTRDWSVDGKRAGEGDELALTVSRAGPRRVQLRVTDPGGLSARTQWEIRVPAPPSIVMATPNTDRVRVLSTQGRVFAVQVETPGTTDPELRYQWRVDGRPVAGDVLFELERPAPGGHDVDVTVTTTAGETLRRRWVVEVLDAEAPGLDRDLVIAPMVVARDLDDSLTPDRKTLRVMGTVQNLDDRGAENVVVWVLALDAGGRTVLRRPVLPAPQPLPPGETGAYEVAMPNLPEIERFKVEVISR